MLANRAHTLILQARLAISLAWVAGYVNIIALATCGYVVSHVTGNATTLGADLAAARWELASLMAALLLAFFAGACISGFAIEFGRQRDWASIYVLPAAIEIALLALFAAGVRMHDPAEPEHGVTLWWMTIVATLSMGVQNATITRISSGVVRTTHLTGIITDLGHESAQLAVVRWFFGRGVGRGAPDERGPSFQRLLLLASILGAFVVGSVCGALAYAHGPHWSMAAPIALLGWIVLADIRTPICGIEEALVAEASADAAALAGVAVFKVIPRGGAAREAHLPDLARFVDGLPPDTRRVVIDLAHAQAFGPLAANALVAMDHAAKRAGRSVYLAGLDSGEVATINALSRQGLLHEGNSAPDLPGALRLAVEDAERPVPATAADARAG
ncbi:MAG: hypothetical protein RL325_1985 [Planctomycetota bacterium]